MKIYGFVGKLGINSKVNSGLVNLDILLAEGALGVAPQLFGALLTDYVVSAAYIEGLALVLVVGAEADGAAASITFELLHPAFCDLHYYLINIDFTINQKAE